MFVKKVKEVERQTQNGRTYTKETTWGLSRSRRKKTKAASSGAVNKKRWYQKEITEIYNTVVEASFNKWWHTGLCTVLTSYAAPYLQYLLVLIPGLPPVMAYAVLVYLCYVTAAVILSYLRRFTVWGTGKLKDMFQ